MGGTRRASAARRNSSAGSPHGQESTGVLASRSQVHPRFQYGNAGNVASFLLPRNELSRPDTFNGQERYIDSTSRSTYYLSEDNTKGNATRLRYPTDVPGCRQAMAAPPKTYTSATRPRRTSRSPSRRTRGRRGVTAVATVIFGGSNTRGVAGRAGIVAVKPGRRPLADLPRAPGSRRPRGGARRKGFTGAGYARLPDDAHQQPGGPLVVVRDNLNTHVSAAMGELVAARDWLTVVQLPPYAHGHQPGRAPVLAAPFKRSLANLAKRNLSQSTAPVRTRLKPMQYRPGSSLDGFPMPTPAWTSRPSATPRIKDRLAG